MKDKHTGGPLEFQAAWRACKVAHPPAELQEASVSLPSESVVGMQGSDKGGNLDGGDQVHNDREGFT